MCGRFTLITDKQDLQLAFRRFVFPDELDVAPRYNIPPSLDVLVVTNQSEGEVETARWGLIPFWAKDPAIGNRMINARSETAAEKPAFKNGIRRKRCLVLADGFYEWKKDPDGKGKQPMYIRVNDGAPFAFAGLWDTWKDGEGNRVQSCTILTTEPNELMADIHNRMPVILPPEAYDDWLEPGEVEPEAVERLLVPFPADAMSARAVSRTVNSPRNDGPECIAPPAENDAASAEAKPKSKPDGRQASLF